MKERILYHACEASISCGNAVYHIATAEGITEELKATNQMEWVGRMNNIHSRVTEIVNTELIFV